MRWTGPPAAGAGAKKKVPFVIFIPPQGAAIDAGANNRVSLEFVAVARNARGETAGQFGQRIERSLKEEEAKGVAAEGISFSQSLEVPPGQYSVRFVVRDNVSGRVGSVLAPLTIQ